MTEVRRRMREVAGLHGVEEGGYAGVLKNFVPLRVADRDVGDPGDESYKKQNNASYKSHCHSAAPSQITTNYS